MLVAAHRVGGAFDEHADRCDDGVEPNDADFANCEAEARSDGTELNWLGPSTVP